MPNFIYRNMKNLISKEEKDRVDSICNKYKIVNYSINPDGSIDVDGDVNLQSKKLKKIPLVFGNVSGGFYCSSNHLASLHGAPKTVGGSFLCHWNGLTSLEGSPIVVGGNFSCSYNILTSLVGLPGTIGKDLICIDDKLSTTYSGDVDVELGGVFSYSLRNLPQSLKDNIEHIKLILKYQRHFEIWNDDLSLNGVNFQILLDEIKDGLE